MTTEIESVLSAEIEQIKNGDVKIFFLGKDVLDMTRDEMIALIYELYQAKNSLKAQLKQTQAKIFL